MNARQRTNRRHSNQFNTYVEKDMDHLTSDLLALEIHIPPKAAPRQVPRVEAKPREVTPPQPDAPTEISVDNERVFFDALAVHESMMDPADLIGKTIDKTWSTRYEFSGEDDEGRELSSPFRISFSDGSEYSVEINLWLPTCFVEFKSEEENFELEDLAGKVVTDSSLLRRMDFSYDNNPRTGLWEATHEHAVLGLKVEGSDGWHLFQGHEKDPDPDGGEELRLSMYHDVFLLQMRATTEEEEGWVQLQKEQEAREKEQERKEKEQEAKEKGEFDWDNEKFSPLDLVAK